MAGMFASGNAAALGLGDIELKSALNQPLVAEIELLSATPAELEELKVSLAAADAFAKAGIDRPLFLTKFRFNVTRNPDGQPVVMITSRKPVREPFLDFLLEVSWSRGRLLREYTVLVDPPVTMPAAPVAPQAPVTAAVPAPAVATPRVAPAPRVNHSAPPVSAAPGEYGPTRRNDTLWKVAERVRPDAGVSMEQTMLGLLRANPDAFYNNNINNLKAGYILRVPSREEMTSISRAEALREARAQYAAWRAARSGPADRQATPVAASKLQLVAPELGEASSGTVGQTGEEAASLDALKRELVLANEAMEAQRRESEEMANRLSVLEEQIRNMQRLIQLKDDELARLQAMTGEQSSAGATVPEAATEEAAAGSGEESTASTDATATEAPSETGTVVAVDAPVTADTAAGEAAEQGMAGPGEDVAGNDVPAPVEADVAAAAPEMPAGGGVQPEPVADVQPEPATPGFVDRLLANPLYLGAGAGVLALLAFFGLRRKRGIETEFQESILQATHDEEEAESAALSEPQSQDQAASESSLLSEFAVSDMGAIKTPGEADPLSEADVYLAYGRYQQAEELIKEALEKDPEREDINLKLLEVYQAAQNQSAFDAHAQAILARLENTDDPMWAKIAEMGRELNPDNPMYRGGAAEVADSGATAEDLHLDIDRDIDIDNETAESPDMGVEQGQQEPAALDVDDGLEFDMDLTAGQEPQDSAAFNPETDMPEFREEAEAGASPDVEMDSVEPDAVAQDDALDFDLEGFEPGEEEGIGEDARQDGELADLDEVSTKLDLARAYIDMGDPDGARSILDEVMEEGNDEQKSEAQGILEQIA